MASASPSCGNARQAAASRKRVRARPAAADPIDVEETQQTKSSRRVSSKCSPRVTTVSSTSMTTSSRSLTVADPAPLQAPELAMSSFLRMREQFTVAVVENVDKGRDLQENGGGIEQAVRRSQGLMMISASSTHGYLCSPICMKYPRRSGCRLLSNGVAPCWSCGRLATAFQLKHAPYVLERMLQSKACTSRATSGTRR